MKCAKMSFSMSILIWKLNDTLIRNSCRPSCPVRVPCLFVPNGQINFFDFQILKIEFCPIFNLIHFFFNFQKSSIIKSCIDFQFMLTSSKFKISEYWKSSDFQFKIICSKFKNYKILKIDLIFNADKVAMLQQIEFWTSNDLYCKVPCLNVINYI